MLVFNSFLDRRLIRIQNSDREWSEEDMVASGGQENSEAVIDLKPALERLENDVPLLRDLANFYLEDGPALLEEIQRAINGENRDELIRASHSLKGLSANFDAHAAVGAAKNMEESGRAGDFDFAQTLLAPLQTEVQKVISALKKDVLEEGV